MRLTMPHNNEAEQAVIGSCLINPSAIPDILDAVTAEDFYSSVHQDIFQAIRDLYLAKTEIDVLTVSSKVPKDKMVYIYELADTTPTAGNVAAYVKILQAQTMRRKLIKYGIEMQESAMDADTDIDEVLLSTQKIILGLSLSKNTPLKNTKELALSVFRKMESGNHGAFQGLKTGFDELDHKLGGLKPGKLYILAARPRMGKTALSKNIAEFVATRSGLVFMASLEMDAEQLAIRHISGIGKINGNKFNTGQFADSDWQKLTYAASKY